MASQNTFTQANSDKIIMDDSVNIDASQNFIEESTELETFTKWDDDNLDMKRNVLRGVYAYGFDEPSPIQQKSIISVLNGRDIIAQAQSGTGKTGAFTIASLNKVDKKKKDTQVVILSPTRELATQTYEVVENINQFYKITSKLLVGGTSSEEDIESIKSETPQIVIGTPGRFHDMLKRGVINSKTIRFFVLDEADEMLSSCFKEQMYNILQFMNQDIQIGLYSATMPPELEELTNKIMRNPVKILVKAEQLSLDGLAQFKVNVNDDMHKYQILKELYKVLSLSQSIIYCNSVSRVKELTEALKQDEFPVISIHSNMSNQERMQNFRDFKKGKYRVLISSDITARGIDVQQVAIVINFDITKNKHKYIHRVGRSARWGRKGLAINFVTRRDLMKIKDIEDTYKIQINDLPADFEKYLRAS